MAVTAKECHALTSYYEKLYADKYGKKPNVNRYSARWGFDSVLNSMDSEQARSLLEYYFTTPPTKNHDLDWFFWNYEKISQSMVDTAEDTAHRARLMEESKLRAEKWRQSGKQGITNN